jgi:hypothetical protein
MKRIDSHGQSTSRRRWMLQTLLGVGTVAIGVPLQLGRRHLWAAKLNEYSTRAIDLVRRSRVVDMLGLLAVNDDILNRWVSGPEGMTPDEIDTFKTSGISTIHMSVGVGGPTSYEDSLHYMAMCNAALGIGVGACHGNRRVEGAADRQTRSEPLGQALEHHRRRVLSDCHVAGACVWPAVVQCGLLTEPRKGSGV